MLGYTAALFLCTTLTICAELVRKSVQCVLPIAGHVACECNVKFCCMNMITETADYLCEVDVPDYK